MGHFEMVIEDMVKDGAFDDAAKGSCPFVFNTRYILISVISRMYQVPFMPYPS